MTLPASGPGPAGVLPLLLVIAAASLVLLAGCITAPPGGQGQPAVTPGIPSYVQHMPGAVDRGSVLLVGRSSCPHCQNAKKILANLSVDYYWIDSDTLDQANSTKVLQAVSVCSDTSYVPMLVVRGEKCVIGDNETEIRSALA